MTPAEQESLRCVVARFRHMAAVRKEVAETWRKKKESTVAVHCEERAECYTRCADELERFIGGETPPEPGCEWPAKE
jgi:hypothetical protein